MSLECFVIQACTAGPVTLAMVVQPSNFGFLSDGQYCRLAGSLTICQETSTLAWPVVNADNHEQIEQTL